jgi:hypothetical protein
MIGTRGGRRLGGALAVLVAVVGVSATAVTATFTSIVTTIITSIDGAAEVPSARAVRVDPPSPVVVIGDSAISALRWVPNARNAVVGFEHTLDLESCRRLYSPSCSGREGRTPPTVYQALLDHNDHYQTLVVATGYNDGASGFGETFDAIVFRARQMGYERIVWYTLRSDVDYVSPGSVGFHETYAATNAVVRSRLATGRYPDVVLADWDRYTAERQEWFATDGVHYRNVGAWAAADYLTRKMAFLDGRSCPIPIAPGEPVQDPCPDPDRTGPTADIEGLYPIGQDGILCYELGDERRFECRYDTHVLQLTRELGPEMTGDDVGALQIRLQRLGYLVGEVDEIYGESTGAAVSAFQIAEGLPDTGVADATTLDALGFDTSAL